VAWEWKVPLPEVRRWSFTDFHDSLQILTDARAAVVRLEARHEDDGVSKLKKALG
jgi:hypothetical protein